MRDKEHGSESSLRVSVRLTPQLASVRVNETWSCDDRGPSRPYVVFILVIFYVASQQGLSLAVVVLIMKAASLSRQTEAFLFS